jgi:hypothetical protein
VLVPVLVLVSDKDITSPTAVGRSGDTLLLFVLVPVLVLVSDKDITSPTAVGRSGVPCFGLCLCPGLCLSQIMTSPVRPQLGGLVIPCFGMCLCCFVRPACLRTRMAVPSGTAIPALSCICCSCSTEIIVPDLEAPRGSVATEWSEGTKIDHEYSFIAG